MPVGYHAHTSNNNNKHGGANFGTSSKFKGTVTCHACGKQGHISPQCPEKEKGKQWCSLHKSSSHSDRNCRSRKPDHAKQAREERKEQDQGNHTFIFTVKSIEVGKENLDNVKESEQNVLIEEVPSENNKYEGKIVEENVSELKDNENCETSNDFNEGKSEIKQNEMRNLGKK